MTELFVTQSVIVSYHPSAWYFADGLRTQTRTGTMTGNRETERA